MEGGLTTDVLVQLVSVGFTVLLTALVAGIAWYLRKYVISEVEKNTAFRRYLAGTEYDEDEGFLGEIQEMHRDMRQRHAENREQMQYLTEYVERIADAVDADVTEPSVKPGGDD
jgi:hypothetical protein